MPREKNRKKLLFVINPISGDIDKEHLERDISEFMSARNQSYEIYYTTGENDRIEISERVKKSGADVVVAVGGDGTCNLVAQVLLHTEKKMGIIPLGSANGLATELNLPQVLDENLKIILKGKTREIDVVQIDDRHLSLHLSDIGLNAKIVEQFENGEIRGFLGYGKYFFGELGKAEPTKFEIEFNGKIKKKKALMIVIANAAKYGTGAVINPESKLDDGYFEIIVVRPQKAIEFIGMIIPFFTRKIHRLNYVDIYKCKKAIIRNLEKQMVQADGEIIGQPEQVFVENLPRSLKVIVPE